MPFNAYTKKIKTALLKNTKSTEFAAQEGLRKAVEISSTLFTVFMDEIMKELYT